MGGRSAGQVTGCGSALPGRWHVRRWVITVTARRGPPRQVRRQCPSPSPATATTRRGTHCACHLPPGLAGIVCASSDSVVRQPRGRSGLADLTRVRGGRRLRTAPHPRCRACRRQGWRASRRRSGSSLAEIIVRPPRPLGGVPPGQAGGQVARRHAQPVNANRTGGVTRHSLGPEAGTGAVRLHGDNHDEGHGLASPANRRTDAAVIGRRVPVCGRTSRCPASIQPATVSLEVWNRSATCDIDYARGSWRSRRARTGASSSSMTSVS